MKHTLSKIALAIMLIHGSVTVQSSHTSDDLINASNDFFDEGYSFTLVEHFQSETWHWGVTSAYACGSNSQDNSGCINEDDTIEHIPVTGNPIDYPDFDNGVDNPADPINDNGSDGDSGGGSSGSDSEPQGPSEQELCLDRVQDEALRCQNVAQENYDMQQNNCQQSAYDDDVSFEDVEECYQDADYFLNHQNQQCNSKLSDDISHCNTYFSN